MFEFAHLGLIVLGVGVLYFLTVGRLLLPSGDARPLRKQEDESFVIELGVPPGSPLIGSTLQEAKFEARAGVEIMKLTRGEQTWIKRARTTPIQSGDIIMARATVRQVMDLIKEDHVDVLSDLGDTRKVRSDGRLVPILLRSRGLFNGRTARAVNFSKRFQAHVIGFDTRSVRSRRLASEKMHVGEVALIEISQSALQRLQRNSDVVVLDEYEDDFDRTRMMIAAGIVAAVVLLAALTPMPIVLTAIGGVIAMVATGCISKRDMYADVSWDVIFLLAGVIPLGIAMAKSGAADWLASLIAVQASDWHPVLILLALYGTTTLLTEIVSNNASAVILVPVALSVAELLGLSPLPLALAVMFAASTSFLSPVGYQTNTMIYGTGVLRFSDFIRVGGPLNIVLMFVTCLGLYWLWPMNA